MLRLWVGFGLTAIVGTLSAFLLFVIGFIWTENGNALLLEDRFLNLQFLTCIATMFFSVAYFGRWSRPSKKVFQVHLLISLILLPYFGIQYVEIRREQRQVLLVYQTFRGAYLAKDYQKAYELISPSWRRNIAVDDVKTEAVNFMALGPEESIYSVHIYPSINQAEIVPDPQTSWWFRPSSGKSWRFEKIGSEWYVSRGTSIITCIYFIEARKMKSIPSSTTI